MSGDFITKLQPKNAQFTDDAITSFFSLPDEEKKLVSAVKTRAYWSVFGICVATITLSLLKHHWVVAVRRYGIRAHTALTIIIYKKLLKLSNNSLENANVS